MKLEQQVVAEREKREKLARSRVQKNEMLIGKFQQEMVEYERKLQELKETNKILSMKKQTAPTSMANKDKKDLAAGSVTEEEKLKKKNQEKDEQIVKMKNDLKAEQLKLKDALKEKSEIQIKFTKEKESASTYLTRLEESRKIITKKSDTVDQLEHNLKQWKEDHDVLLHEKQKSAGTGPTQTLSYSQLQTAIKRLE